MNDWTEGTGKTLDALAKDADSAITKAACHLEDKSLSDLGKQERIAAELTPAREKLEDELKYYEERFNDQKTTAQAALSAIPIPSPDELAALGYVRDVLRARFKGQKSAEIFQGFQAALEGSDKTLIRAYMLEASRAGNKPANAGDNTPALIQSLVPKAEEKLRTPEQKAAAKLLTWLDSDGVYKLSQLRLAISKLKTAKIQGAQLVTNESGFKAMAW